MSKTHNDGVAISKKETAMSKTEEAVTVSRMERVVPKLVSDYRVKYEYQTEHQDAYICVDWGNKAVSATFNAEIGDAETLYYLHGHEWHIDIPCWLKLRAVQKLVRQIAKLADEIVDLYDDDYDDNGNRIADWQDDEAAQRIRQKMERLVEDAMHEAWWGR